MDGRAGDRRVWFWWGALVAVIAATLLVHVIARRAGAEGGAGAAGDNPMLSAAARYAIGSRSLVAGQAAAKDMAPRLLESVEEAAQSLADHVRVVAVAGELLGAEAARERIDDLLAEQPRAALRTDLEALRRLYAGGPEALDAAARARLDERLGWFGDLALVFDAPEDDPDRRHVLAEARQTMGVLFGGTLLAVVVFLAGSVLFAIAVGRARRGQLTWRYEAPPRAPGDVVWLQTVVLFTLAVLLIQLVPAFLGLDPGPWFNLLIWLPVPLLLWPLRRGASWEQVRHGLGWHRGRGVVREIGAGLVGYVALAPVAAAGFALTVLLSRYAGPISHPGLREAADATPIEIVALFFSTVFWAPVAEEAAFRGAFFRFLRSRCGTVATAVVVGLVFAVLHPQGWAAVPALGALGASFALLRQWRGSLIAPMTAHAAHNAVLTAISVTVLG